MFSATGDEEEDFTAGKRIMKISTEVAEREGRGGGRLGDGGRFGVGVGDVSGGEDDESGCRNGVGKGECHGQGSQIIQGQVEGQGD